MHTRFNGDEAFAHAAISAGISFAAGYPGTPGSGVLNVLIELAHDHDLYVEWSTNERVAIEMAIGVSMAGRRALVCTKSVGMNVMLDPMMCLNLTGVHGGLVILLGDDPGGYGSQNDQDTRNLATMLEIPMLEPSSIAEGYDLMREAFDLSERFNTAVILRVTRSFIQQVAEIALEKPSSLQEPRGFTREPLRFVPYPGNAVAMHRNLHERLAIFQSWAEQSSYNQIIGSGPIGILASGFAHSKVLDVLGDRYRDELRILKLGCLYPIPKQILSQFMDGCEQILVLEENDPYVENCLKASAYECGYGGKILGKESGDVNWEGELFRWHIQQSLDKFLPGFKPETTNLPEDENSERPTKIDHCAQYAYEEVLELVMHVAQQQDLQPIIIADPGCMVKVAEQLDAKFAIGSSVALASGLYKAGVDEKIVAFFGDSAFFHSAIPAICNAAYNQSEMLIVLLDNRGAASTGLQPTPGVGLDALGNPAPKLDIPEIARACGVDFVQCVEANASESELRQGIESGLSYPGLAMLIVEIFPK